MSSVKCSSYQQAFPKSANLIFITFSTSSKCASFSECCWYLLKHLEFSAEIDIDDKEVATDFVVFEANGESKFEELLNV
ncbi:hypothetical protein WICMUC_000037 [Wickerhamomyces mucosus]|uniref:Uncharacterized protein n=1 Tax=Wickerhamomyces mucosus TaxID=1378264 RepID=A0A9P8Q159_9ASCO|nr:hypothetical protein WICMUC_000037 [Wickerhamomyces mucosus]